MNKDYGIIQFTVKLRNEEMTEPYYDLGLYSSRLSTYGCLNIVLRNHNANRKQAKEVFKKIGRLSTFQFDLPDLGACVLFWNAIESYNESVTFQFALDTALPPSGQQALLIGLVTKLFDKEFPPLIATRNESNKVVTIEIGNKTEFKTYAAIKKRLMTGVPLPGKDGVVAITFASPI